MLPSVESADTQPMLCHKLGDGGWEWVIGLHACDISLKYRQFWGYYKYYCNREGIKNIKQNIIYWLNPDQCDPHYRQRESVQ